MTVFYPQDVDWTQMSDESVWLYSQEPSAIPQAIAECKRRGLDEPMPKPAGLDTATTPLMGINGLGQ